MDSLANLSEFDLWDEFEDAERKEGRRGRQSALAEFGACGRAEQRRLKRALETASQEGRAEEVQRLLGAWRWWPDKYLMMALKVAANGAVVRVFAEAAPALLRGGNAEHALLAAASEGRESALAALLDLGLDPNGQPTWARVPPLHAACAHGHAACVRLLLEHGADAKKEVRLLNALHFAAVSNSAECVEILLQHGLDHSVSDSSDRTPLFYAADRGATECVRALVEGGAEPNARSSGELTPLIFAAMASSEISLPYQAATPASDHQLCVKELIRLGADPQVVDDEGQSVLYYVIKNGTKDLFHYFIDRLTDFSKKSHDGETPLHWASYWAKTEFIRDLISFGIDINNQRNDGMTPLHLAIESTRKDCANLQELLDLGGDVHARDSQGWTALHLASSLGRIEMIPVLLRAGADIMMTTNAGETPLHFVISNECLSLLLEHGAAINAEANDGKMPVHSAAAMWHSACLTELLNRGADVHARNNHGWTTLHYAADYGAEDNIKLLVKKGLAVDTRTTSGTTALHMTAVEGYVNCVQLLLRLGAAVDARDDQGRTPLHLAAFRHEEDVVRVLLEGRADRRARDADGHTPADLSLEPSMRRLIRCWAVGA